MKLIRTQIIALLAAFSLPLHAAVSLDAKDEKSILRESDTALKDSAPVKAGSPAETARRTFEAGAHAEAVKLALPLAEKGDVDAIYLMGFAHETGQGAERSAKKAEEFYRKGMAKNHADSAYRLSFMLMSTKDKTSLLEAQAILEKQALSDPAIAGRILGEAFLLGRLTGEQDPDKAVKWWKNAADAGDIASMLFIARFHDGQMGFTDRKDPAVSLLYFGKAAEAGNTGAMVAVGSRLLYGDEAGRDEKRGLASLEKAIAGKDATAYLALGTWQQNVKKDPKAALAEFERGKDAGQPESMLRAAEYYIEGKGTKKDVPRGLGILEKAAEEGNAQAHLMLAANILQSEKPDTVSGYKHLLAAANGGMAAAQNELGLFYLSGGLGLADVSAAVSWFGRAAQANFAAAQNNLGALHERGTGVDQSYEKAAQFYALAAQQGHASATLALARFHAAGAATEVNRPRAWALGKIAGDRGEGNAAKFLETLEKEFSKEQLAGAKAELEKMTSDKPVEKPAEKSPVKPAKK